MGKITGKNDEKTKSIKKITILKKQSFIVEKINGDLKFYISKKFPIIDYEVVLKKFNYKYVKWAVRLSEFRT